MNGDTYDRCLVTVDGTHFRILNQFPNNSSTPIKDWFSQKFKSAGVNYEVAVCIKTGDIVWIHGPFPAATHDITVFRYRLRDKLTFREQVMADLGYRGDNKCMTPLHALSRLHKRAMSALRGRHETVNRRFKTFGALEQRFRHDVNLHHLFFRSAAVLVQLAHQAGYSHYDVVGYVDPAFEATW